MTLKEIAANPEHRAVAEAVLREVIADFDERAKRESTTVLPGLWFAAGLLERRLISLAVPETCPACGHVLPHGPAGCSRTLRKWIAEDRQSVGCETADGLIHVHPASETCEVCAPAPERETPCPGFRPTAFKGNICERCGRRHHQHAGALMSNPTPEERPVCVNPVCVDPADCCRELSRVWLALNVMAYTGKSAHEHVAALAAENARLRQAQSWQPIETAPLLDDDSIVSAEWVTVDSDSEQPTHRMPLPPAPDVVPTARVCAHCRHYSGESCADPRPQPMQHRVCPPDFGCRMFEDTP